MNLFARRRVADLQAEALTDQRLKRVLGPGQSHVVGHRCHHRRGHFCPYRPRSGAICRTSDCLFIHPLRSGLRVRRALLRGIRLDDSAVRLGLHIRLRDARRIHSMDHRLEFDSRILVRRLDRRRRMVRLCCLLFKGPAHHDSRRVHVRTIRSHHAARRALVGFVAIVRPRLDQHRRGAQCPGNVDRCRRHRSSRHRHQGIGEF
jgi:hypothetical protein